MLVLPEMLLLARPFVWARPLGLLLRCAAVAKTGSMYGVIMLASENHGDIKSYKKYVQRLLERSFAGNGLPMHSKTFRCVAANSSSDSRAYVCHASKTAGKAGAFKMLCAASAIKESIVLPRSSLC